MLEYALKQERLKFNKLKYGSETVPLEDQKSTSNEAQNFEDGLIRFVFIYFIIHVCVVKVRAYRTIKTRVESKKRIYE